MAPANALTRRACYTDINGVSTCDDGSYGTRVGIGFAVAAGLVLLFLAIGCAARRRRARAAKTTQPLYTTQPVQSYHSGAYNYAPQAGDYASYSYPPHHGGAQHTYGPPAGPPPDEEYGHLPPSMPPPSYQAEVKK